MTTLSGTNTYTGGTMINGGAVSIAADANLGASTSGVTLNGGTLTTTNTTALTNTHAFTIGANGGTLNIVGTATTGQNSRVIFGSANTLLGSGALTVTGAGTLAGTAPNTTAGGAGALVLNAANNGAGGYSGTVTLQNGGLIEYEAANALASGAIVNLGNEGEFTVDSGLTAGNAVNVNGGTNSVLSFTNGAATFSGNVTANNTLTVGLRNWYNYAAVQNGTISGPITGAGGITVNSGTGSGGTLTLSSATSDYSGVTTVNSSVVNVGTFANVNTASSIGKGSAGGSSADLVLNAGTLRYTGATAQSTNRLFSVGTNGGTLDASGSNNANPLSFTGTGAIGFNGQTGTRTLTLAGTNTGANTLAALVGDNGGATSVTKSGAGTWMLTNANTYTGVTTVGAGILSVASIGNSGANSNLGANGTINLGATTVSGTLSYTGTGETSDKVLNLAGTTGGGTVDQSGTGPLKFTSNLTATGVGAKTLTLSGSTAGTGEIAGNIVDSTSGATALAKSGSGTWTISGANNTYTGSTTISGGTLVMANATALGNTSTVTFSGTTGTLDIATNGGDTPYASNSGTGTTFTIVSDRATAGAGINHTLGTGSYGGGTVNVTQGANVTSGTASLTLGAITLSSGSPQTTTFNPTTATASLASVTGVVGGNNHTLNLDGTSAGNAVTGVIANNLSGGGITSLTKTNSSTWTLSGANTYTGGTAVSAGTLALNSGTANSAVGTGTVTAAGTSNSNVASATQGVLQLANNNQIADNSAVTLNGGTINTQQFSEGAAGTPGMGTLALTNPNGTFSFLDYGTNNAANGANSTLAFAASGTTFGTTGGILEVVNYEYGSALGAASTYDHLFIGTDNLTMNPGGQGLTAAQLANIQFVNPTGLSGTYSAAQLSNGEIVPFTDIAPTPEPGSIVPIMVGMAGLGVLIARRRKAKPKEAAQPMAEAV